MGTVKVAVVTGSNKGIGFAIVRGLCKQFPGDVYLTARDETRGKEAVKELEKEGLHPNFHQLDIENPGSVEQLRKFLADKYGGLDILVNNAGMAYKHDSTAPFTEQAEVTLKCNYWGTLKACNGLFPLLRPHARVVHVSSEASTYALGKCSDDLKKQLKDCTSIEQVSRYMTKFVEVVHVSSFVSLSALGKCSDDLRNQLKACSTIDEVSRYMNKFVEDVKAGNFKEQGWPETAYGISKVGVTLITPIQQREFDSDSSRQDIVVNACCPGYVDTDMTSHKGPKTIDQGADTPLYLALLPENITIPRGNFLSDRVVKSY